MKIRKNKNLSALEIFQLEPKVTTNALSGSLKLINHILIKKRGTLINKCIKIHNQGIFMSISGPTLTILAQNVCKSPETLGWIFTARSIGFLVGALIPSIVEKYNGVRV